MAAVMVSIFSRVAFRSAVRASTIAIEVLGQHGQPRTEHGVKRLDQLDGELCGWSDRPPRGGGVPENRPTQRRGVIGKKMGTGVAIGTPASLSEGE
jgi:hypothetical protein